MDGTLEYVDNPLCVDSPPIDNPPIDSPPINSPLGEDDVIGHPQSRDRILVDELLSGLNQHHKSINPKFFYDERGSELFDQITHLPEYYPTRTEIRILQDNADAIAHCVGKDAVLIEPGAGSCHKVRFLLESVQPIAYIPQDISKEFLYRTAGELGQAFPWLCIEPLVGDFSDGIVLPESAPEGRRVIFYPGSTIGNFEPSDAIEFLRGLRHMAGSDGGLIIGVDLQKDPQILNAAYNDVAGITAEFNRNILNHANHILGSHIIPEHFEHRAFYNVQEHRIEMHLICKKTQDVMIQNNLLHFREGESIYTENSYKYTVEGFAELAGAAGFNLKNSWLDDDGLFSVHYFV